MATKLLTYNNQQAWKDIQAFLPSRLHFSTDHCPTEEWWQHRGHTIHLDRWRNASAKLRVILHHGVGTNGRQMSMILGVPLHNAGFELVAVDMPGYGCTQVASDNKTFAYDEWVQIGSDFIDHELENDPRRIALYGLSAGGMLTYHIAALNRRVCGIVGMTFLDLRLQQVVDETSRDLLASRVGMPLATFANSAGLHWLRMPMSRASKMSALVNNGDALKIFLKDKSSAGSSASLRFLSTYASYKPAAKPEEFDVCPILLTQPAEDRWTSEHLSNLVLERINKVSVKKVLLTNAGHYPLEDPGLQQMVDAIVTFLRGLESPQEKL